MAAEDAAALDPAHDDVMRGSRRVGTRATFVDAVTAAVRGLESVQLGQLGTYVPLFRHPSS